MRSKYRLAGDADKRRLAAEAEKHEYSSKSALYPGCTTEETDDDIG
jgi:hypothetical protein